MAGASITGSASCASIAPVEVEKCLGQSPNGLSTAREAKRWDRYGPNEIAEHQTPPLPKVTRLMHCLPAVHHAGTDLGGRVRDPFALEVAHLTDGVCESPASIASDEAQNRWHTAEAAITRHAVRKRWRRCAS